MKLYTQRKNFAAKDVILKCRMFHQCDIVQGMQNETAKNIKQSTFGIRVLSKSSIDFDAD